jgi:secreted trypsin-like serine protease
MIKRLLFIISLLGIWGCTDSPNNDPATSACNVLGLETRSTFNKIVQGTECKRSGSPVVFITVLPDDGSVSICTGTLLTSRTVLTAAHCFDFAFNSASVQVAGVDYSINRVLIHPEFNSESIPFQNDVALVELSQDTGIPALPIILSRTLEPGDIISIFGYGIDENFSSDILRSGEMRVTGINSQFFSANFELAGSNTCQGDSGGPAILTFDDPDGTRVSGIIGITSFGEDPCQKAGVSGFQNIQSISVVNFLSANVPGLAVR